MSLGLRSSIFFSSLQNARFRKSRQRQGGWQRGRGRGKGGPERVKARPGLGSTPEVICLLVCLSVLSQLMHSHPHLLPQTFSAASSSSSSPPTAVGPMGALVGPGGNRASVLKSTMQAQYRMRFQMASSSSLSSTSSLQPSQDTPPPSGGDTAPPKKKRKSRWD